MNSVLNDYIRVFEHNGECPYGIEKDCVNQIFQSDFKLNEVQFDFFLKRGWRKFGYFYFRPFSKQCCVPIRVLTDSFSPSKSQRRILKKTDNIEIQFKTLNFRKEIYDIYVNHCKRFPQTPSSIADFIESFFNSSAPSFQSEYYLNKELIAVGFLDFSHKSLSSVYFIYKNEYSYLNLGTFSILKEIEYAKELGLKYYYLGYYIKENPKMAYKNNFFPNEKLNWEKGIWETYFKK